MERNGFSTLNEPEMEYNGYLKKPSPKKVGIKHTALLANPSTLSNLPNSSFSVQTSENEPIEYQDSIPFAAGKSYTIAQNYLQPNGVTELPSSETHGWSATLNSSPTNSLAPGRTPMTPLSRLHRQMVSEYIAQLPESSKYTKVNAALALASEAAGIRQRNRTSSSASVNSATPSPRLTPEIVQNLPFSTPPASEKPSKLPTNTMIQQSYLHFPPSKRSPKLRENKGNNSPQRNVMPPIDPEMVRSDIPPISTTENVPPPSVPFYAPSTKIKENKGNNSPQRNVMPSIDQETVRSTALPRTDPTAPIPTYNVRSDVPPRPDPRSDVPPLPTENVKSVPFYAASIPPPRQSPPKPTTIPFYQSSLLPPKQHSPPQSTVLTKSSTVECIDLIEELLIEVKQYEKQQAKRRLIHEKRAYEANQYAIQLQHEISKDLREFLLTSQRSESVRKEVVALPQQRSTHKWYQYVVGGIVLVLAMGVNRHLDYSQRSEQLLVPSKHVFESVDSVAKLVANLSDEMIEFRKSLNLGEFQKMLESYKVEKEEYVIRPDTQVEPVTDQRNATDPIDVDHGLNSQHDKTGKNTSDSILIEQKEKNTSHELDVDHHIDEIFGGTDEMDDIPKGSAALDPSESSAEDKVEDDNLPPVIEPSDSSQHEFTPPPTHTVEESRSDENKDTRNHIPDSIPIPHVEDKVTPDILPTLFTEKPDISPTPQPEKQPDILPTPHLEKTDILPTPHLEKTDILPTPHLEKPDILPTPHLEKTDILPTPHPEKPDISTPHLEKPDIAHSEKLPVEKVSAEKPVLHEKTIEVLLHGIENVVTKAIFLPPVTNKLNTFRQVIGLDPIIQEHRTSAPSVATIEESKEEWQLLEKVFKACTTVRYAIVPSILNYIANLSGNTFLYSLTTIFFVFLATLSCHISGRHENAIKEEGKINRQTEPTVENQSEEEERFEEEIIPSEKENEDEEEEELLQEGDLGLQEEEEEEE